MASFSLIDLLLFSLLIDNPDVSVANMVKEDGSFKLFSSLCRYFPRVGELLNRVIISSLLDRLAWMPVNLGVLTSNNFYAYSLGLSYPVLAWKRIIWSSFILPSRSVFF